MVVNYCSIMPVIRTMCDLITFPVTTEESLTTTWYIFRPLIGHNTTSEGIRTLYFSWYPLKALQMERLKRALFGTYFMREHVFALGYVELVGLDDLQNYLPKPRSDIEISHCHL